MGGNANGERIRDQDEDDADADISCYEQLTSSEFLRELDRSASGLLAHQAQFQDVKAKIEKRKRKLVDYDSSRHAIQQARQAKKKDDPKLIKAEEKNSDARRMYESLNQVND